MSWAYEYAATTSHKEKNTHTLFTTGANTFDVKGITNPVSAWMHKNEHFCVSLYSEFPTRM